MSMSTRQKIFFVVAFLVFTGFILAPFLSEARPLEVRYPKIPGVAKAPTAQSTLPQYLAYLYYFTVDIVGIIAFVILVIGGIQYLTAGGSVTRMVAAKKTIIGGGTGLLIVLGAFLTLRTINPQLVGLKATKPIPLHGICLYANKGQPNEEEHCYVSNVPALPKDFKPDTLEFEGLKNEIYQVFVFPKKNYQGGMSQRIKNTRVSYKAKAPQFSIPNIASIYFDNQESGILLFPNEGATYKDSNFQNFPHNLPVIINSSVNDLKNFNDRTKSIQLRYSYDQYNLQYPGTGTVNDWIQHPVYPDVFFGAILHTNTHDMGECSIIYKGGKEGQTFGLPGIWPRYVATLKDVDIHPIKNVRSVEVFNHEAQADIQGSVTFYEDLDYGGKSYTIPASEIKGGAEKYFWKTTIDQYPWHDLNQILSIKVDGNFWVVLTDKKDFDGRCQTFTASTKDLKSTYVLSGTVNSQPKPYSIAIIPIHFLGD